jgi:hypothetical protein
MEDMARVQKKTKVILISVGALVLMVGTVPLAIWVTHTQSAQAANEQARCSSTMQPVHKVFIKDNKAVPSHTVALQCDTLEIINQDNGIKLMAFGPHEHHVSYDGVSERALGPGQSFSVKLVQVGTFTFHDHITDAARGSFTVSK